MSQTAPLSGERQSRLRRRARAVCGAAALVLTVGACGDDGAAQRGRGSIAVPGQRARPRPATIGIRSPGEAGEATAGSAGASAESAGGTPSGGGEGGGVGNVGGEAGALGYGGEAGVPGFCGDGLRQPGEPCDSGVGRTEWGCSSDCRVQVGILAEGADQRERDSGLGPHAVSVSDWGGALVTVESGASSEVKLFPFAANGRSGDPVVLQSGSVAESADPVVAALPGGGFVAAFTSYGSSTAGLDVRVVRLLENGAFSGITFPGDSTVGAQRNADVLALEDRVVVAWTDGFSDIFAREFDFDLTPLGPPIPIASSEELEDAPALAPCGGTWCLAFRQSAEAGEYVGIFAEGSLYFSEPQAAGADAERPALTAIGDTALLVATSAATLETSDESATEIVLHLVDLDSGSVERFALPHSTEGSMHLPGVAWFGQRLLLSYQSEELDSVSGDIASRAYVREITVRDGTVGAGKPRLLSQNASGLIPAAPRVADSAHLAAIVWAEPSQTILSTSEIRRLLYPLPLANDSLYTDTLPERAP